MMKKFIIIAAVSVSVAVSSAPMLAQVDAVSSYVHAQNWARILEGSRKNNQKSHKTSKRKVVVRHPRVKVNGQLLQSAVAPIQRGGHAFVPMRSIFKAMGATVTYNSKNRVITAERNGRGIQLVLDGGDSSKMKGSKTSINDAEEPFVVNGVTMVPLRLVSEKMGAQVVYTPHPTTPLISITNKTS